jgi:hypothetical protein
MATKRIKDITNTAASVASDAYLAIDGTTNGTEKITRDNFRADTAAAFVAAPGTYNIAPLSGGAVPIANGGTAATTAAGARTSLDVPSTSEAALVANNLSDVTAATARTNLSVNSVDEDAEAIGTKLLGPSIYFDGSNDYVEVADDAKLSFTDGTDDLPFTLSAFVKLNDATNCAIVSKYGSGASTREWLLYSSGSDYLGIVLADSGGNTASVLTTATMTSYEGQWIHVAAAYGGSGPNSNNAFSAAADSGNLELYINGVLQTGVTRSATSYAGMSDTAQAVNLGRFNASTYGDLEIRNVQIFDYELSATEVAKLARGNELGYSDQWGGNTVGAVYTSDFSTNTDGNTGIGGTTAGNIDAIGGQDDNLRLTINSSTSDHYFTKGSVFTAGIRYRMEFDYYIPNTNAVLDGISAGIGEAAEKVVAAPTLNQWNHFSVDSVAVGGPTTGRSIYIFGRDGGVRSFAGNGTDVLYVRNIQVTQIGTLADFRSERFGVSEGKWYDLSDNAFVGTNTGATLVGREIPVYETGSWTPVLTFGGGSTGITYTSQEGYYTRIGNTVTATGGFILSAKGSSTGSAAISLPLTARNTTDDVQGFSVGRGLNMAGLTSAVSGYIVDNTTSARLMDWGATGAVDLDEANFTNTTEINMTVTYQIS